MKTPICDFIKSYSEKNGARLHMPGHKGKSFLGFEGYDITEIVGADSLYEADGIISESEKNASELFGSGRTFYSAEGSSQCIRAMLAAVSEGVERPLFIAARNAHKTFIYAAALLDADILWIKDPEKGFTLCRSRITPESLESALDCADRQPTAVYLTSPDYLGGELDVKSFAMVAHERGIPLIVDNAHGAYLKFLPESRHPIDLGADMCCDSAHKTLPALTGGAYLHISKSAITDYSSKIRRSMALFGSTSPSYLILASLDAVNGYLADGYRLKLSECIKSIDLLKSELIKIGYSVEPSDPLKLTVKVSDYGYRGEEFAEYLSKYNISIEYFDPDYAVMMLTPENSETDREALLRAMSELPARESVSNCELSFFAPETVMSVREAILSKKELVPIERAVGHVLAEPNASCPPAVTPVSCGERITAEAVKTFGYYGIKNIYVVL